MNLIDMYVVEVIGEPYEAYGRWLVKVKADGWGHVSESTVMCRTLEEAENVKPGFVYQA
jgi:hypothetical protein